MKIIHGEGSIHGGLYDMPVKQVVQHVYHIINETVFSYVICSDNIDNIFCFTENIIAVWKIKHKEVKNESI